MTAKADNHGHDYDTKKNCSADLQHISICSISFNDLTLKVTPD